MFPTSQFNQGVNIPTIDLLDVNPNTYAPICPVFGTSIVRYWGCHDHNEAFTQQEAILFARDPNEFYDVMSDPEWVFGPGGQSFCDWKNDSNGCREQADADWQQQTVQGNNNNGAPLPQWLPNTVSIPYPPTRNTPQGSGTWPVRAPPSRPAASRGAWATFGSRISSRAPTASRTSQPGPLRGRTASFGTTPGQFCQAGPDGNKDPDNCFPCVGEEDTLLDYPTKDPVVRAIPDPNAPATGRAACTNPDSPFVQTLFGEISGAAIAAGFSQADQDTTNPTSAMSVIKSIVFAHHADKFGRDVYDRSAATPTTTTTRARTSAGASTSCPPSASSASPTSWSWSSSTTTASWRTLRTRSGRSRTTSARRPARASTGPGRAVCATGRRRAARRRTRCLGT